MRWHKKNSKLYSLALFAWKTFFIRSLIVVEVNVTDLTMKNDENIAWGTEKKINNDVRVLVDLSEESNDTFTLTHDELVFFLLQLQA